jgi:hypothetical protein
MTTPRRGTPSSSYCQRPRHIMIRKICQQTHSKCHPERFD